MNLANRQSIFRHQILSGKYCRTFDLLTLEYHTSSVGDSDQSPFAKEDGMVEHQATGTNTFG